MASDVDRGPSSLTYQLRTGGVPIEQSAINWLRIDSNTGLIYTVGATPATSISVPLDVVISDGQASKQLSYTLQVTSTPASVNLPPKMDPVTVYDAFAGQTNYELHFHVVDPESNPLIVTTDPAEYRARFFHAGQSGQR